jgi:hypothetical protein
MCTMAKRFVPARYSANAQIKLKQNPNGCTLSPQTKPRRINTIGGRGATGAGAIPYNFFLGD